MFSEHIENSSLISLINISQSRIALQVASKMVTRVGSSDVFQILEVGDGLENHMGVGRWMRVENVQFRSTPRVTT
jgi:hypothetical protein